MKQLLAFGAVGVVGFVIDGGLLTVLSQFCEMNIYLSRLFSFTAATITTWLLNRAVVFKANTLGTKQKRREYGRYLFIQVGGALLNLTVFSLLIKAFPGLRPIPVVPLAAGALFGLIFNYSGARYWVFKKNLVDV